jgi:16S rRNA (guanine527-N7)-methyltransferase
MSKMQVLHILDSASCYDFIKGPEVLDVGTGAGLPGVVLAILNPSLNITLIDSNSKKIRFLRQCKLELGINNIHPLHLRIEDMPKEQKFDTIISRAFASFDDFADNCLSLLTTNGILVSMKGKWDEKTEYTVSVNQVFVPFLEGQRHIITHQTI